MSRLHELDALGERITASQRRVREVDQEVREAAAKVEQTRNEIIEAHAAGDDALAAKLGKQRTSLEEAHKRLREEKYAGVTRAAQRAEADRLSFITTNYLSLIVERRPEAEKVAGRVEDALAELVQAYGAWQAFEGQIIALMGTAGRGQERTPPFPQALADSLREMTRRGLPEVPVPLPDGPQYARIPATDDPDDVEREAARARAIANSERTAA